MRKKTKKQRRTAKQSKPEFTAKTRVYDLVKSGFHSELKCLIDDISPNIRDGDNLDWKHFRCFNAKGDSRKQKELVLEIAKFLIAIGKGNGLKCKMSVFVRYLASNEHSNFGLKYRSLNTLIYRMFSFLEGCKKETEKL